MLVKNLMSKVKVTLIAMSLSAVATVGYGQKIDAGECTYRPAAALVCVHYLYNTNEVHPSCNGCNDFYSLLADTQGIDGAQKCLQAHDDNELQDKLIWIENTLESLGYQIHDPSPSEFLDMFCGWEHGYWSEE